MDLKNIGWDSFFEDHLKQIKSKTKYDYNFLVGRVSAVHTNLCQVLTEGGEITAQVSGKMRDKINNETTSPNGETPEPAFPAVGDWVMMIHDQQHNSGIIRMVLPRRTKFSRNAAGATSQEQVIAANIDYAFIVAALNADFNPSRIERYLVTTWNSGAVPVILLNKADLCTEVNGKIAEMEKTAVGVQVHAISAAQGEGLEQLTPISSKRQDFGFYRLLGSGEVHHYQPAAGPGCHQGGGNLRLQGQGTTHHHQPGDVSSGGRGHRDRHPGHEGAAALGGRTGTFRNL